MSGTKPIEPNKRKPRSEYVYASTKGTLSEVIISIDPSNGRVGFDDKMENIYSETSYERPKGPKILSRIPQSGGWASFGSSPALHSNFDFICAVDTNTREIRGGRFSVVAALIVSHIFLDDRGRLTSAWRLDSTFSLLYLELELPPENVGWLSAIEQFREEGYFTDKQKVGVIVDSDLGNLRDYNQRTKPTAGRYYLPKEATLIYASSDSGKPNIENIAIARADFLANQILRRIEDRSIPLNDWAKDHPHCRGFRLIRIELVPEQQ